MPKNRNVKELLDKHQLSYELDDSGKNYKVKKCVFCGNQKSKLEVLVTTGGFKCWVCKNSGSFFELQSKLDDSGSEVADEGSSKESFRKKQSVDLNEKALKLHDQLSSSPDGTQFLTMRGFNQESIDHFQLGVDKRGSQRWLSIPHTNDGVVVNIKYRSLPPLDKKWRQEEGTQKVLFNGDVLKKFSDIVLTEGELKTIALHQVGIKNVAGLTGGISNVPQAWVDQLREKRRVYICMDSDEPGQNGALDLAKRIGINKCFNIVLEDAKDPDEYLFERKHTKSDFQKLVTTAQPFEPHQCFSGLKRAKDIAPEKVRFMWGSYIAIGKITLLEGNPGVGKSHLALAVVSAISRGDHPWPIDLTFEPDSREILIFCGEDGAGDTIVPRLRSLGADLENVHIFSAPITFDEKGLVDIEAMIESNKPGLVIFDPLTSFMGRRVDINRANEVRDQLSKVAQIAERHSCALLIVRHLNKGSKDHAIYRGLGSIDMAAVARSILMVGKHPSDESLRVLVHVKSNLSKEGPAIQFKLDDGIFSWAGKCELSVDDILYPNREAEQDRLEKAKDFLIKELSSGPVDTNFLKQQAATLGLSERTLERAKAALGLKSRRVGSQGKRGSGHYEWYLNESNKNTSEEVH